LAYGVNNTDDAVSSDRWRTWLLPFVSGVVVGLLVVYGLWSRGELGPETQPPRSAEVNAAAEAAERMQPARAEPAAAVANGDDTGEPVAAVDQAEQPVSDGQGSVVAAEQPAAPVAHAQAGQAEREEAVAATDDSPQAWAGDSVQSTLNPRPSTALAAPAATPQRSSVSAKPVPVNPPRSAAPAASVSVTSPGSSAPAATSALSTPPQPRLSASPGAVAPAKVASAPIVRPNLQEARPTPTLGTSAPVAKPARQQAATSAASAPARPSRQGPTRQLEAPSRNTEMDALLDDALAPRAERGTAAPGLPQVPAREDVVKSMSILVPAIRGCAQGGSGLAPMSLVVRNDGRVESAALSGGPFMGTASGRCMEGVVRRARFPRFQQSSLRLQFPFAVQ